MFVCVCTDADMSGRHQDRTMSPEKEERGMEDTNIMRLAIEKSFGQNVSRYEIIRDYWWVLCHDTGGYPNNIKKKKKKKTICYNPLISGRR